MDAEKLHKLLMEGVFDEMIPVVKWRRIRLIDEEIQQAKIDCEDIANRIEKARIRIEAQGEKIKQAIRLLFS